MHLKPFFAHNSTGEDTRSHSSTNHKKLREESTYPRSLVALIPLQRQRNSHLAVELTMNTQEDGAQNENTLIKRNRTETLSYSLWSRAKWLMITWTDMNWV